MRRSDREISEIHAIEKILAEASVCRLAMVDNGEPYVVPLNYGYQDGTLYFHGAAQGRKYEALRSGGRICFEVTLENGVCRNDNPCGWDWYFQTVIGYGTPFFIETAAEKREALAIIMAQYSVGTFAFPDATIARVAVFSVKIDSMTAKEYRPI